MRSVHRKLQQDVEEISVFQTKIPRPVGARIPLLLLMINFVGALFLSIWMAEGSQKWGFSSKAQCRNENQGRSE